MTSLSSFLTRDQKAELKDGLEQIAKHYGIELQSVQLVQEMAEYIQAQSKAELAVRTNRPLQEREAAIDHEIEEFADTGVVWLQVFMLMHPDYQKLVVDTMLAKVRRQLARISQENDADAAAHRDYAHGC